MERFYDEKSRASWCVRDREILIPIGPMLGQAYIVQWCSSKEKAEQIAQEMNNTRGHAADEPRCVRCGKQPAGSGPPLCASCHALLADLAG
jgi:hypothetical protein